MRYGQLFRIILAMDLTKPISDENLTVIDTDFSDIPVRLYLPTRKSERRRPAIIFIHGGAMTQGSCSKCISFINLLYIYYYVTLYISIY